MKITWFIALIAVLALVCSVSAAGIVVKIDGQTVGAGGKAVIPVKVTGASNLGGVDLTITYDPAVLKFTKATQGALSTNGMIESNETRSGTILIGMVDTQGMSGDGNLVDLSFDVIGAQGSSSQMNVIVRGAYGSNLKDVANQGTGGTITVGAPGSGTGGNKTPLSIVTIISSLIVVVVMVLKIKHRK
jgi:hypothetical protein